MMQKLKLGISAKISIGYFCIVIVILIASGVALMFFRQLNQNYQKISLQEIPAVIMTSKLLKITQRLISDAPSIILKENQLIRESLMREMRANIKKKDELLRALTLLGPLEIDIRAIDRQFNLLVENLNLLYTLSSQRIDIAKDTKQMVARLRIPLDSGRRFRMIPATHSD